LAEGPDLPALVLLVAAPQVVDHRVHVRNISVEGVLLYAGHQVAI
jgi:hypothetical protein